MTLASITQAANDEQLRKRVEACAQKEARSNPNLSKTNFANSLIQGYGNIQPLMWPVATATEAAYYAALQTGRGAPGHDTDIITDTDILSAVQANWPPDIPVAP
jgi:hypothetical protein